MSADGVGGDRQDDGRQSGRPEAGEVGLTEVAGAEGAGAVRLGEVVAEDAGPDEGLDVEVDDIAAAIEVEGRLGQRNR